MNLQREGYLKVAAFLRFEKLGYPYAYILLKLRAEVSRRDLLSFEKELLDNKYVFDLKEIMGNYNLLIGVFSEGLDELYREINNILMGRSYIQDYIILSGVKTLKSEGISFPDALIK